MAKMILDGPAAFWLVGPPGSGKSTYIDTYLSHLDPAIISSDDLLEEYAREHNCTYDDAFRANDYDELCKRLRVKVMRAALADQHMIFDQTNCTVESLTRFMPNVPSSYIRHGVFFTFRDVDLLLERTAERARLTGKVVPPEVVMKKCSQFNDNLGMLMEQFSGCITLVDTCHK